jgi:Fe(3+) dicitrate transport protein
MKTIAVVPGALALAIANILFVPAYAADDATPAADQGQNATELPKVEVREHSQDDTRPKLQYIMKEVDGPLITVTKKTTVTKLDNIPTIVDN